MRDGKEFEMVKKLLKDWKGKKRGRVLLEKNTAVYHVVSKSAFHEFRFSDKCKEMFRSMLERQAEFCGVEVLAFCFLDNHFHLLVRIPYLEKAPDDKELIRRYEALYGGRPVPKNALTIEEVKEILLAGGSPARALRKQLLARMADLAVFVKELKQRFGIWYNDHFDNVGTLWCERFKSVLIEDVPSVLKLVAAYIDLNPVRAGICKEPESYLFSTIGEACAGGAFAQRGLMKIFLSRNWQSVRKKFLYLMSDDQPLCPGKGLAPHDVAELLGAGRTSPVGLLLREQRLRVFSEGGVLGTSDFVQQVEAFLSRRCAWKKRFEPKPVYHGGGSVYSLYILPSFSELGMF